MWPSDHSSPLVTSTSNNGSNPTNDYGVSYDPGPPRAWEDLFGQAPLADYAESATRHFQCAFGPVFYRGRLNGRARVLVIGQDPSLDELYVKRVLVGRSGQRVQGLLRKAGIVQAYIMVNVFLFGVRHSFDKALRSIALQAELMNFRNSILDKIVHSNRIEALIAMGDAATLAIQHWPGLEASRIPVIYMAHPTLGPLTEYQIIQNWNAALSKLRTLIAPEIEPDPAYYGHGFTPDVMAPIPRFDLPFGVPDWLGSAGTHGVRLRANRIAWRPTRECDAIGSVSDAATSS